MRLLSAELMVSMSLFWKISFGMFVLVILAACTGVVLEGSSASGKNREILAPTDTSASLATQEQASTLPLLGVDRTTPSPTPTRRRLPTGTPKVPLAQPTVGVTETLTPWPTNTPVFELCSPLEYVALESLPKVVSDPYRPPPMGSDARHQGTDFAYYRWNGTASIAGTQVRAVMAGRVAVAEADTFPFGNVVVIETHRETLPADLIERFNIPADKTIYTLYAHMQDAPIVSLEQEVAVCQSVGKVGSTGNTNAAHLHLEMRFGPPGMSFVGFAAYRDGIPMQARDNYFMWSTSGIFLHFDPMLLLAPESLATPTLTPTP
jgi:murein DD-endopeptidase MepM/ murein hydrolase activator NlpD